MSKGRDIFLIISSNDDIYEKYTVRASFLQLNTFKILSKKHNSIKLI